MTKRVCQPTPPSTRGPGRPEAKEEEEEEEAGSQGLTAAEDHTEAVKGKRCQIHGRGQPE